MSVLRNQSIKENLFFKKVHCATRCALRCQGRRKLFNGGRERQGEYVLTKSVGQHGWPAAKNVKIKLAKMAKNSPKKRNLEHKIND